MARDIYVGKDGWSVEKAILEKNFNKQPGRHVAVFIYVHGVLMTPIIYWQSYQEIVRVAEYAYRTIIRKNGHNTTSVDDVVRAIQSAIMGNAVVQRWFQRSIFSNGLKS